jgi:hypothetical protein
MGVKLASSLPDDDRRNGMDVLFPALVRAPEDRHVVVLVVDCAYTKVTHTPDGPLYAPAAGIIHAEPITDGRARDEILHHLAAHRAERQGEQELDLDFGKSEARASRLRRRSTSPAVALRRGSASSRRS